MKRALAAIAAKPISRFSACPGFLCHEFLAALGADGRKGFAECRQGASGVGGGRGIHCVAP